MISLETIGYFSDAPHSQTYPSPGLGIFYPKVGNFIGFVGNVHSRTLLRRVIALFRQHAKIPSKARRFPRSFLALVGRINGHSGETVIPPSWSPTPRRFAIPIIILRAILLTNWITTGSRWWSVAWRK